MLADDVHLREPGDRNATIVAFVRDCRSEATTRPGTSCGTGRQGRSLHPGKVGARAGSAGPVNESCVPAETGYADQRGGARAGPAGPVNESCVPAETGYADQRGGVLAAGFLPPAVPVRAVCKGWGDGGQSGTISDDHTFWPSAPAVDTTVTVNGAVADVTAPFCVNQ